MTKGQTNTKVFNTIYKYNLWLFGSGTGSVAFFNKPYLNFINSFLEEHQDIQSVVDIGCGDWQIGRHVKWGDRKYTGCDVSNYIVEKTQARYGSSTVSFQHLDAVEDELPQGDLAIVKDVLQHLPTKSAQKVLDKLDGYKYVIMQNDILDAQGDNRDIKSGQFRPLDVTKEPFNKADYKLVHVYTEGLRKPLNLVRRLFGFKSIRKGIFVKVS